MDAQPVGGAAGGARWTRRRGVEMGAALAGGAALAACGGAPGAPSGSGAGRSKAPFTLEVLQSFSAESEPWFKDTFVPQYQARVGSHVSVNYTWVDWAKMEDHFVVAK